MDSIPFGVVGFLPSSRCTVSEERLRGVRGCQSETVAFLSHPRGIQGSWEVACIWEVQRPDVVIRQHSVGRNLLAIHYRKAKRSHLKEGKKHRAGEEPSRRCDRLGNQDCTPPGEEKKALISQAPGRRCAQLATDAIESSVQPKNYHES